MLDKMISKVRYGHLLSLVIIMMFTVAHCMSYRHRDVLDYFRKPRDDPDEAIRSYDAELLKTVPHFSFNLWFELKITLYDGNAPRKRVPRAAGGTGKEEPAPPKRRPFRPDPPRVSIFQHEQVIAPICGSDSPTADMDFGLGFNSCGAFRAESLLGGVVMLPCEIAVRYPGERLALVMWYKEGNLSPIYSYDLRGSRTPEGKRWANEKFYGKDRARFYADKEGVGHLMLKNVQQADAGLYRCRADFEKAPTRNHMINLTIVYPIERLAISTGRGGHIPHYQLGPFNEGDSLYLSCVATGGVPLPQVSWWQEENIVDNTSTTLGRRVENVMRIELRRAHTDMVYTCKAINTPLLPPIVSAIRLNLNLRPTGVKLLGPNKPLSVGREYQLHCEVYGAVPPPTITWWKGNVRVPDILTTMQTKNNGTTSLSILTYTPTLDDRGKFLSCRGEQPLITESGLEDGWKLEIRHAPIVNLELGSNTNSSMIKEGADVYFECNVKANPSNYHIKWMHQDTLMYTSPENGILLNNQSLVLRGINRTQAGFYTCSADNNEGVGVSQPVLLDIKFAPVCRPGQLLIHGVARGKPARIPCELEANSERVNFSWSFKTSTTQGIIPNTRFVSELARSVVQYTPLTDQDFGSLLCWGTNEIGEQEAPCVFDLIPAGKPEKVENCTISNITTNSFIVDCQEGYDGGLSQEFAIEVYNSYDLLVSSMVNNDTPHFRLTDLSSGENYKAVVFGVNKKGNGEPTNLKVETDYYLLNFRDIPFIYNRNYLMMNLSPLVVVLVILGAFCLVSSIILCACCRLKASRPIAHPVLINLEVLPPLNEVAEDSNPDVVPPAVAVSNDDLLSEEEKAFDYLKTALPRKLSSSSVIALPTQQIPMPMMPIHAIRVPLPGLAPIVYNVQPRVHSGPRVRFQEQKLVYTDPMQPPVIEQLQGSTLPRILMAPLYTPVDTMSQHNMYATLDCRTSKAGILEASSSMMGPITLPPPAEFSTPDFMVSAANPVTTKQMDSASLHKNIIISVQDVGDNCRPMVSSSAYQETERF